MKEKFTRTFKNFYIIIPIVIIAFTITLISCIPVGDESVNAELFESKEDLKTLATSLKPGMTEEEALKIIDIPVSKFTFMSTEEIQRAIYGNSLVQGSPLELEEFKNKLLTYKGYYLPYKYIENESSIGLGKMKYNKKGHDLRLILLFERGVLLKATVDGSPNIDHYEDKYMWNSLIQKGAGFAF